MRFRNYIELVFLFFVLSLNVPLLSAQEPDAEFLTIGLREGLAGNQVNVICKSRDGYLWFGTSSGLSRFDGYHCKNFNSRMDDPKSLLNDCVNDIVEDGNGRLWVNTSGGYCVYDPATEAFDRNPVERLRQYGINGGLSRVFVDRQKNLYVYVNGQGCYVIPPGDGAKAHLIKTGNAAGMLPPASVADIKEADGKVVVLLYDGSLSWISPSTFTLQKTDTYLRDRIHKKVATAFDFDRYGNYWVETETQTYVFDSKKEEWHESVESWLVSQGVSPLSERLIISDVKEDGKGNLWLATNHEGLVRVNLSRKTLTQFKHDRNRSNSLPDNTISTLMFDKNGALWIGTYKNGVGYYWNSGRTFTLWPLGDVCTLVQDADGNIWCGTNDNGIVSYTPRDKSIRNFHKAETGLLSDVVVCSMKGSDGALWFGSFNGGLTRYKDGVWKAWHAGDSGLASNDVWALVEAEPGKLVIGTIDAGLQTFDTETASFTTFDTRSTAISSDNIASLSKDRLGNILIGHSNYFSSFNPRTLRFENYNQTKGGRQFLNNHLEQIYEDSRGLIWLVTPSGLNVYDMLSDQLYSITSDNGLGGYSAIALAEDAGRQMWVATDKGVSRLIVGKTPEGGWTFDSFNFTSLDGLQRRQFNGRSMLATADGKVLIGGQEGVNVLMHDSKPTPNDNLRVVFSGVSIFDTPILVGEEYDGRVVLPTAIDQSRKLEISHKDKYFTIQLACNEVEMPTRHRFSYRLKGLNDKWMITPAGVSELNYTNLSPGTYTLQVRLVDNGGVVSGDTAELKIVVTPPFYRTFWMYMLYAIAAALIFYYLRKLMMRRQQERIKIERIRQQATDVKQLNEMKMRFFTNASHELRTPLTLVISPLKQMMDEETDTNKKEKLQFVHRNANKLLILVNQLLDLRKIEVNGATLMLKTGDIILFIKDICEAFQASMGNKVSLTFFSHIERLVMSFDDDKVGKIMNNLLSNAFKFTENGGRVDVSVRTVDGQAGGVDGNGQQLEIKVADTGKGISDTDKQHIFERFYQADNQVENPFGGSGIGLNLVYEFVKLHNGDIHVEDNPGGGTVFIVHLPVRTVDQQPAIQTETASVAALDDTAAEDSAAAEQNAVENAGGSRPVVLVVDDNPDFLEFMKGLLGNTYQVQTAEDGKQALEKMAEQKPDIILSDVMMPEMDGNELCRAVKNNPSTARIPFVMLTARMAQEQKISGLENGADDYITKPFNLDLLNLRIANLIKWSRSGGKTEKLEPKVKELEITSLDEKLVADATDYIENHLTEVDLNVETLSSAMSMSRSYLYKRILSVTGHTPSEFIRLIRLRYAEQLLRKSQLSVSEITYKVGFPNTRSFTKFFKEMYGVLPSQYKDAHGT